MRPLAKWNPARDVWETDQTSLLCEHLGVFSATFPTSGMWADGTAYALRTSAPLTDGHASSSSPVLPTPNTHNGKESGNCRDFGGDLTHALTCACKEIRT